MDKVIIEYIGKHAVKGLYEVSSKDAGALIESGSYKMVSGELREPVVVPKIPSVTIDFLMSMSLKELRKFALKNGLHSKDNSRDELAEELFKELIERL
jgi:hypothetical protein